ncbi:hypothetical protein OSTOST_06535 [Ostertagia ostertagi]
MKRETFKEYYKNYGPNEKRLIDALFDQLRQSTTPRFNYSEPDIYTNQRNQDKEQEKPSGEKVRRRRRDSKDDDELIDIPKGKPVKGSKERVMSGLNAASCQQLKVFYCLFSKKKDQALTNALLDEPRLSTLGKAVAFH